VNRGYLDSLFSLLRLALGADAESQPKFEKGTAEEWSLLYSLASKLSAVGIAYAGICKLPKDKQPPLNIAFQWASEAETIRGHNRLINGEAARLTELFKGQGRRTAILKGAANARLYPDKFMRQCGDIDIWIEGGKESVIALLQEMGLMEVQDAVTAPETTPQSKSRKKSYEEKYAEAKRELAVSGHHVHLSPEAAKVTVEAHFRSSSGNLNPVTSRRLMRFLEREILEAAPVPEGFNVPPISFALAMQLSHIQRHFLAGGIGLKQILDYFELLMNASEEDRSTMTQNLRRFGLSQTAGALMWLLHEKLGLPRERLLCNPDARRGKWMLEVVLSGGNFGFYSRVEARSTIPRWFGRRWRVVRFLPFAPVEILWAEIDYWKRFAKSIPIRIRLRKLSIRDLF